MQVQNARLVLMPGSDERILLIEDDPRVRDEVRRALERDGHAVSEATCLSEARVALREGCALVLLDLGLPDGDGLDLCREMRRAGDDTPVVIATARDASEQRIRGLDAGADDYVVKPFDTDVLLAHLRSVLRRSRGDVTQRMVRCGSLWADAQARTAGRGAATFDLTQREFDFLLFLMKKPGRVWSREQILEQVWGLAGGTGGTRTVDIHVKRLRAKIEPEPSEPVHLTTVWGVGYRMNDAGESA